MKAKLVRSSFKKPIRNIRDGRALQREANAMLMKSRAAGTPLPEEYLKIRRLAEEALNMWDFQRFELERYGRLQPFLPSSRRTFYRVIKDHFGHETLVLGQGGNIGYLPKGCAGCPNIPAGSAECMHYECVE